MVRMYRLNPPSTPNTILLYVNTSAGPLVQLGRNTFAKNRQTDKQVTTLTGCKWGRVGQGNLERREQLCRQKRERTCYCFHWKPWLHIGLKWGLTVGSYSTLIQQCRRTLRGYFDQIWGTWCNSISIKLTLTGLSCPPPHEFFTFHDDEGISMTQVLTYLAWRKKLRWRNKYVIRPI